MPTDDIMPHDGDSGPPRRGGHDPLAPQMIIKHEVTGRLRTGHTRDFADESEPVVIREADDLYPGADGLGYAEARCRECIAQPYLVAGEDETLLLEHQDRCPFMDGLLRETGSA